MTWEGISQIYIQVNILEGESVQDLVTKMYVIGLELSTALVTIYGFITFPSWTDTPNIYLVATYKVFSNPRIERIYWNTIFDIIR